MCVNRSVQSARITPNSWGWEKELSTQTGVIVLVVGLVGAAVLATVVSRWTLKMDRRAKRRRQREIQRRRRIGGIDR
jgi:hypothetical protein